jgi:hypothetical protein
LFPSCDGAARKSKAGKSTLFKIVPINDLCCHIRFVWHPVIESLTCGIISSRILLQRLVIPNSRPMSASKISPVRYEPYRPWNSECHKALRSCSTVVAAWPTCCHQSVSQGWKTMIQISIPASVKIRTVDLGCLILLKRKR